MDTVGLGDVELQISLKGMDAADMARLERITVLLRLPSNQISELDVPQAGVNKMAGTAVVIAKINDRGRYTMGCRLHFVGGTSITTRSSTSFIATDGMA